MGRRKKEFDKHINKDHRFNSDNIAKFICKLMIGGKKRTAERIFYTALAKLSETTKEETVKALEAALKNVMPLMEVKSRRVGGSTYQVPIEVRKPRAISLAMRWIIANAHARSGKSMADRLSQELIDAFNKTGASIKKREDTHKMAEANKAFAHFRW